MKGPAAMAMPTAACKGTLNRVTAEQNGYGRLIRRSRAQPIASVANAALPRTIEIEAIAPDRR
jgi:hypothetical protein